MTRVIGPVKAALWSRLATDGTLTTLLGGTAVFDGVAPLGTGPPFVVYAWQGGGPEHSLSRHLWDNTLWTVKAVTEGSSTVLAGQVAERIDVLLDDATLSISGATQLYLRRAEDVEYGEISDEGDRFNHVGAVYRLLVAP